MASTYTPGAADVGKVVTVKVTGTKPGFTPATKESAPTAAVAKGTLALTPTPTVIGTPRFGQTLTAGPGTWDPGVTFTYQWLADGIPVAGAVGSGYLLKVSDVGRSIVVFVTGSRAGYSSVTRISGGTTAVAAAPLADTQCVVKVTGKAKVGKKLTTSVSGCPAGATLHYSWYAGSKLIAGADQARLTLKKKQLGKKIQVLVSVSVPGYLTVIRPSDPTGKVKQ
jgi:hypothetical protein